MSAREGRGAVLPALGMRTRRRDEFARPGISGTLGVLAGWPWDDACGLPRVQSVAEHSSRHRTEKCLCLSPSCRGWHSGSAWVDDDNQARWVLRGRLAFEQPVVPQMERAGRAESEPHALRPCS